METTHTLTVEAIYQAGVIIPMIDIPLQENERIKIRIERRPDRIQEEPRHIVHLRGIWKDYLTAADKEEDWVCSTVAAIRCGSNLKVEQLVCEIDEALSDA
jgi:predicted DNA-binding antitoxin AbrB/MazE fold protein